MKIIMIKMSPAQENAINSVREIYKMWWKNELLKSWENGKYSEALTTKEIKALQEIKNIMGSNKKQSILGNLKYENGEIEPIVRGVK